MGLTSEEFASHIEDETVQSYMRLLGFDVNESNAEAIFGELDFNNEGKVSIEDFVGGLTNLGGAARELSLFRLERHVLELMSQLQAAATPTRGRQPDEDQVNVMMI